METIEFFVQQKRTTDDGKAIFFTDDQDRLARTSNTEPFASIELGETVQFHGEWKQGQKRKYFNVSGVGNESPSGPPKNEPKYAPAAPKIHLDDRNKSFALAYAKDITVASMTGEGKITAGLIRDIIKRAQVFEAYLEGDISLEDEALAKLIMELNKG